MNIEVLISINSTKLTLTTMIIKQDSIKILEKPLLLYMSSQIYTIGNAKNVIICLGHQKN